jgi:hypothetical protein
MLTRKRITPLVVDSLSNPHFKSKQSTNHKIIQSGNKIQHSIKIENEEIQISKKLSFSQETTIQIHWRSVFKIDVHLLQYLFQQNCRPKITKEQQAVTTILLNQHCR